MPPSKQICRKAGDIVGLLVGDFDGLLVREFFGLLVGYYPQDAHDAVQQGYTPPPAIWATCNNATQLAHCMTCRDDSSQ